MHTYAYICVYISIYVFIHLSLLYVSTVSGLLISAFILRETLPSTPSITSWAHSSIYLYVYMYLYVYIYMYIYIYIYIYIFTHVYFDMRTCSDSYYMCPMFPGSNYFCVYTKGSSTDYTLYNQLGSRKYIYTHIYISICTYFFFFFFFFFF